MTMARAALIAALTVAISAAAVDGQFASQPPTFSARADLVVLRVSVLDRKARPVAGLGRKAFSVFEDGVKQSIAFFSNEDMPVTAGVIIDASGSMLRKRHSAISSAMAFASTSNPHDEIFLVFFNELVQLGLPDGVPFTSDYSVLRRALLGLGARGRTALFDAIWVGLDHAVLGRSDQRALVVISDGRDNASERSFDTVLERAIRSDAVIYAVGIFAEHDPDADRDTLQKLARATGGNVFFPNQRSEMDRDLRRIAQEIRSAYVIGYAPMSTRPGYRAVQVRVQAPDRRHVSVRHRPGYFADVKTQ